MMLTKNFSRNEELISLYENIYSELPVGIVVYNEKGQCYFTTKKTAQLVGAKTIDDILSQNYHEIKSWKDSGLYNLAIQALKNGEVLKTISNVKTSFGKNEWFEFICKPLSKNEKKDLLVIVSDVTEIKENEEYYKEQSLYDSLTGLHNRRCFDERIEIEIHRCRRSGKPFSLILIDIDYFKKFNDHYGHLSGDECLRYVATSIKDSLKRKPDCVARYGGEEFICILPYTDEIGAMKIAKRIRSNINSLKIPHGKSDVSSFVTISQGVCTQQSDVQIDVNSFVNNTDIALYSAKNNGRNRIEKFEWTSNPF